MNFGWSPALADCGRLPNVGFGGRALICHVVINLKQLLMPLISGVYITKKQASRTVRSGFDVRLNSTSKEHPKIASINLLGNKELGQ